MRIDNTSKIAEDENDEKGQLFLYPTLESQAVFSNKYIVYTKAGVKGETGCKRPIILGGESIWGQQYSIKDGYVNANSRCLAIKIYMESRYYPLLLALVGCHSRNTFDI